jgi:hypothetical protein
MAEAAAGYVADLIYGAFEYSAATEIVADIAAAATYVAVTAAISYGVSAATRPDSQKDQGAELNLAIDADYPRQMIIGKRAIAGSLSAHYANKPSNYNLHLVYALADHPCTSLEAVYADGRMVWGTPLVHGVRTEISTYNYSGGPRVWMTWHDGRPGQTADGDLITASSTDQDVVAGKKPAWTSAHVGAGVSYVHVELQRDSDILTSVPAFLFVVKGAPLYDRRKDTTAGGSGSHRLDDPSTWEYSENARVAQDHYLLGYKVEDEAIAFGVGLSPDEVPYDDFAAAADLADEVVTTGTGGDVQDLPRYASNGVIGADEDFETVIEAMQLQMAARVVDLGGRIGILGAEERTTLVDLTDQDQIADENFEFDPKLAFDDLIGAVEGRFADPGQLWQPTDFPRQVGPWAVFADGGEAQTRTIEYRFETNVRRATRNASTELARDSLQPRIIGRFNKKAWKLEVGDWLRYSSPHEQLELAVFEVIEIVKYADFTVALTAKAIDPDFIAFDNDNDPDLSVPPDFDPVNLLLDAPSGTLANASITGGGATEPALKFTLATIDALARELVLEVRKWDAGTAAFVGDPITIVAHSDQAVTMIRQGVLPNSDYKARAKCRAGHRESPWTDYSSAVTTSTTYTVPGSSLAAAIVGQGALATLNTVTASVLAAGVGKNCIIDGDFRQGTAFWGGNAAAGSIVQSAATGGGIRYINIAGTGVTVGQLAWAFANQSNTLPVVPDDRIEASAYVGGANISSVVMSVQFLDNTGSYISESGGFTTSSPGAGGGDLSTYTRIGGFVTAPANAKRANIIIYAVASTTSPTLKIAKPFIARATAAQTELTPWNIGFEAAPGSDITGDNVAAAIAGQAAAATDSTIQPGATKNTLTFASSAPSSPTDGDIWVDTSTNPYLIKTRVSSAWQASGSYGGVFGGTLYETSGGAVATLANFKTISGTAAAIAGQGDLATTNKSTLPFGANALVNADFTRGSYGFTTPWDGNVTGTVSRGLNTAGFYGMRNVWWAAVSGASSSGQIFDVLATQPYFISPSLTEAMKFGLPCVAGDNIFASAQCAYDGLANLTVSVRFYDRTNTFISEHVVGTGGTSGGGANGDLANFSRVGGFVTAPATAAWAGLQIRANCNGTSNAKAYVTEPMIGKVPAGQNALPPFDVGRQDPLGDQTNGNTAAAVTGQGTQATANSQRGSSYSGTPTEGSWWADTTTNTLKYYTGGAWQAVAALPGAVLTATFSPSFPQDARTGAGSRSISTTITISGGSGSYSQVWSIAEQTSAGGTGTAVATLGATRTSTTISAGCSVTTGQSCSGHLQCFVTDTATGQTAVFMVRFDMSETT